MQKIYLIIILTSLTCILSCKYIYPSAEDVGAEVGSLNIGVDETLKSFMAVCVDNFKYQYPKINVKEQYQPANNIAQNFVNNKTPVIVLGRFLNDEEENYFKNEKIALDYKVIAYDAIAFLVNKQNIDSLLTINQIVNILKGNINNWQQLNPKNQLNKDINIVFDNQNSSTIFTLMQKTNLSSLPKNAFAVNNNNEIYNYIANNKNAIGIIGASTISNLSQELKKQLFSTCAVVSVADSNATLYYKPDQTNLATKKYPITREIYFINRDSRVGTASNFAYFLASPVGQKIILKAGILPYKIPERPIKIGS